MKLTALLEDLEYTCCQGDENTEVTDVVYDSRKVQKGSLFLCIRGAVVDGHTFCPRCGGKRGGGSRSGGEGGSPRTRDGNFGEGYQICMAC